MSECGAGGASPDGAAVVLGVSTRECLIDARFDIALGLTADCRQF